VCCGGAGCLVHMRSCTLSGTTHGEAHEHGRGACCKLCNKFCGNKSALSAGLEVLFWLGADNVLQHHSDSATQHTRGQ